MSGFGSAVDDAIMGELYPGGQEPFGNMFNPGDAAIKSTVAALEIIERHLEPVTSDQLAALALLRGEGGVLAEIAEFWMENHKRRGSGTALVEALGHASLIRSFRGVQGNLMGGRMMQGPLGGGRR